MLRKFKEKEDLAETSTSHMFFYSITGTQWMGPTATDQSILMINKVTVVRMLVCTFVSTR